MSFLLLLAQVNDLLSGLRAIIFSSVALIAKFRNCTFSSSAKSINNEGFFLANNNKSLLSSLDDKLETQDNLMPQQNVDNKQQVFTTDGSGYLYKWIVRSSKSLLIPKNW